MSVLGPPSFVQVQNIYLMQDSGASLLLAFPKSPSFAFKTYSNCFSTNVILNRIPDLSE